MQLHSTGQLHPFGYAQAADGPAARSAAESALPTLPVCAAAGLPRSPPGALCHWLAHQRCPIYAVTADTVSTAPAICGRGTNGGRFRGPWGQGTQLANAGMRYADGWPARPGTCCRDPAGSARPSLSACPTSSILLPRAQPAAAVQRSCASLLGPTHRRTPPPPTADLQPGVDDGVGQYCLGQQDGGH